METLLELKARCQALHRDLDSAVSLLSELGKDPAADRAIVESFESIQSRITSLKDGLVVEVMRPFFYHKDFAAADPHRLDSVLVEVVFMQDKLAQIIQELLYLSQNVEMVKEQRHAVRSRSRLQAHVKDVIHALNRVIETSGDFTSPIPVTPIPSTLAKGCLLGKRKCPEEPIKLNRQLVFVGYPYSPAYFSRQSFKQQVAQALEGESIKPFFYDDVYDNDQVSCKICAKIQECRFTIFDITDGNLNVMIELGLAFGLGKQVVILKQANIPIAVPSDIKGIERVEYADMVDLLPNLMSALAKVREQLLG